MKYFTFALIFLFSFKTWSRACDRKGLSIIQEQKKRHSLNNEFLLQNLKITDVKSKVSETRQLKRYIHVNKEDQRKSLIAFTVPSDIKGTALLTWEQKDREDDQWMYNPTLKKMLRIAGGDKKKFFMGTDFTYVDLESEQIEDYNYNCLKLIKCAKAICYEIEAKPKDKKIERNTGYSKRILLVRQDTLTTLRVKYFDKRERLEKQLTNSKWKAFPNGVLRSQKSFMERYSYDSGSKADYHTTEIYTQEINVSSPIDENTFSERFVTKGMHIRN